MASSLVELSILDNNIALITLNRPEAANALSSDLIEQLGQTIDKVNNEETVYCTMIIGKGEKAFCAGADLKERKEMNEEEVIKTVTKIGNLTRQVEQMKMPVIAVLNGAAFGGGLELALACDFRISSTNAHMGLTETSLAIIPGAGGTQRLPRTIGISQAKRLIYTAKAIDASEALQIGLVDQVADSEIILDIGVQIAESITKNGPIALSQAKKAINQGVTKDIDKALELERACYLKTIPTEDRLEGLAAFQEKRSPSYKGQ